MQNVFDDIDHQLSLSNDPHHLQFFKSYRNSLAPVSRLPHDLLTDIFILLHRSDSSQVHPIFSQRSPPCLHVTHVSRAWRDAALQCPLLWTTILFIPPEWTTIMLERSQTAPLTVQVLIDDVNSKDDVFKTSVRLSLSHVHRIRYLSIMLHRVDDLDDILFPFLSGSLDILEELQFSTDSALPNLTYPSMERAPCLRRLELRRCHIDWRQFPSVGNLTSLVLHDIPMDFKPSMDDILSIFRAMNKLERLTLTRAIPELSRRIRTLPPPKAIVPVNLEYLSCLSLTGFALDCANLMRYLVMPRCRQITLEAESFLSEQEVILAIPPLANIISSIFCQLDKQELPYLASIAGDRNELYKGGIAITARPEVGAEEVRLNLHLVWRRSRLLGDVDTPFGFGNLVLRLPLGRIVHFSASTYSREEHLEDAEWLEVLLRLSRVETVLLLGGYTYRLANAFHNAHFLEFPSGADVMVLPKLVSLEIRNAHFSFPLGNNELFSTLKRALTRRLELGWTAPKITLVNCHVTSQQLVALNILASQPVDCIGEAETWGIGELDDGSSDEDSFPDDDD